MPRQLSSPSRLFSRTWRGGHPFQRRLSRGRRFGIGLLCVLLLAGIGFYWWITDGNRVRAMAEISLSELTGGHVVVRSATLSLFNGLRLEDVSLWPAEKSQRGPRPIFQAQSLAVDYNAAALLSGQIEATQIVATGPRVNLAEDVDTGRWNFETLDFHAPGGGARNASAPPMVLPQIVLRNAQVHYAQLEGKEVTRSGSFAMEGQLSRMAESSTYRFNLQTRGATEGTGPAVSGTVDTSTGEIRAAMTHFVFGPDIQAMLPYPVQSWCERHRLAGKLEVPELAYHTDLTGATAHAAGASTGDFKATISLSDATLRVEPEEWLGLEESRRLATVRDALNLLAAPGEEAAARAEKGMKAEAGDFWTADRVDRLGAAMAPSPITLQHAEGDFTFTQSGIDVNIQAAQIEDNTFRITGQVAGYAATAAAHVKIASAEGHDLIIPANPKYVSGLPAQLREIYDRFRPQGHCRVGVDLDRENAGDPLLITGRVDVISGMGEFQEFPYPVQITGGSLLLKADPVTGAQTLVVTNVVGHGMPGGANADAKLKVDGWMGPLGPEARVDIKVSGDDVHMEPVLMHAFPPGAQKAIRFFDADGHGKYPTFSGSFVTHVTRDPNRVHHWAIDTDVHVADAAGKPSAFPYVLEHVSGDLAFRGDQVTISNGQARHGDGRVAVSGIVAWGQKPGAVSGEEGIRPDLDVRATGMAIDADLRAALPADRREWLEDVGLTGTVDMSGHIGPARPEAVAAAHEGEAVTPGTRTGESQESLDFELNLRDGVACPPGEPMTGAITDVTGRLKLTEAGAAIENLSGRRGPADISMRGTVDWSEGPPTVDLQFDSKGLVLDANLYRQLPEPAKHAWDAVHPAGTIDVTATYRGLASELSPTAMIAGPGAAESPPTPTAAVAENHYSVTILPKGISALVQAAPYQLTDVTGRVEVNDGAVKLIGIKGQHGKATVAVDGTGSATGVWDLALHLADAPVDDQLVAASPTAVGDLVRSTSFKGTISLDVNHLRIGPHVAVVPGVAEAGEFPAPLPVTSPPPAPSPTTTPPVDVDFDLVCRVTGGSMDLGVPLTNAEGSVALMGAVYAGETQGLKGTIEMASASIADRPFTHFKVSIDKLAGQDFISFHDMQAYLAGGQLAGNVEFQVPDVGTSRYAMALVVNDADVRLLSGETGAGVRGRVAVSLSLQGDTGNPYSRQGRGELRVTGQNMYHMPLVLGLLQITNLALPISSPFNEGTARYSVQGMRVVFDDIELKAKDMFLQGNGYVDYVTRQVQMTFFWDSTAWPKVPVIGDLLQGARHDMLQIHVRGTVQDPQVSAGLANTFTTTVDNVLRGGAATQPRTTKQSAKPRRYGY